VLSQSTRVGEAIAGDIGKDRSLRRIDSGTARIVIPAASSPTENWRDQRQRRLEFSDAYLVKL